jgi:uncharacterized protein
MKNFNTGENPGLRLIDIAHRDYCALIEPDTAFWALIRKDKISEHLFEGKILKEFADKSAALRKEMETLRFGLKPSAVYFNPTDKCNLNCKYCYIPSSMRKNGINMSEEQLIDALGILKKYFKKNLSKGIKPQLVFHGAEPLVNKSAMFKGISKYAGDFLFGIQTNATLLSDDDIAFIKDHNVMLGISMDGPSSSVSDATRRNWDNEGTFSIVEKALEKLSNYDGLSVICTVSSENMDKLDKTVEYFHKKGVGNCLINILRCTQPESRKVKPDDLAAIKYFIRALEKSHQLFKKTGRKIIIANFANILYAILAPSARRLMCDISPCGGGRCFFAVAANGDMFPCSEFIGLKEFKGGNLFNNDISNVLKSEAFKKVTGRLVENIEFCKTCTIRHFCGSPCPAEAHAMNGDISSKRGAFCEFYEEQTRYAFRLIADERHNDFLPDNWDKKMETIIAF